MESRTPRNLSIKSTWMPRPALLYARSKNMGGGGEVLASCTRRQYRRCKYLTKIRRLSFSALFVLRVSTAVRSRKSVRCLRNYLPPRSFDDSIGNFRWMKEAFLFPSFFPSPVLLLLFCFLFPIGRLGIGPRRVSKNRSPLRVPIPRPEKYRRGNINRGRVCCASVPSSRVTQFRYE